MEYQVTTQHGHATDGEIEQAVRQFLVPAARIQPGSPSLAGPGSMAGQLATSGKSTPPGATLSTQSLGSRLGPGAGRSLAGDPDKGIKFHLASDLGGLTKHYFVYDEHRLLSTDALGNHMHWQVLTMSWHAPLRLDPPRQANTEPPATNVPVRLMTDRQKLTVALERALEKSPGTFAREFFTATNIIIMVGMILLLMSTGILEVLALGVMLFGATMGGLDLVLNVTQLAVDGYQKAIAAQNDEDLDAAAELFSEALTKGLFDILSIVTGYKAVGLLKGKGIVSVGKYFAYLKQELAVWRASRAAAAALEKPPMAPPPSEPPLPPKAPKPPTPPKGPTFSSTPKASELRAWAKEQGYELLSNKNGIETWGIKGEEGGWRLKLKQPSTTDGIDPGSQKWRYSARISEGKFYDPTTGKTGTRGELGHLDLDPN